MKGSKSSYRRLTELAVLLGLVACLVTYFRPKPVIEPEPKPLTAAQKANIEKFFDDAKAVGSTFAEEFPRAMVEQVRSGTTGGVIQDLRAIGEEVERITVLQAESESLTAELEALDLNEEGAEAREAIILQRLAQIDQELLEAIARLEEI